MYSVHAATYIFSDGFESGDFSAWTSNGEASVQQIVKHHGAYAAQFSNTYARTEKIIDPSSLVYGRIYVNFNNFPSVGNIISLLSFCDSETYVPDVVVGVKNDNGVMKWGATWDTYGSGSFAATPNPSTSVWYCVELKLAVTAGVGYSYEVWVDGVSILTQNRNYSPVAAVNTLLIGGWDKSEALTTYIDCVVVSDAYIGMESPLTYPSSIFKISVNSAIHSDYGLTYPATYEFRLQTNVTAAKCYYRFTNTAAWMELPTKNENDFFNGINAARFDYVSHKAYISIGFSADTDEIYLKFTDGNSNEIDCDFNAISKYYDDRRAVVTISADDWDGNYDRNLAFMNACDAFQDANIWLSVGVITTGHYDQGAPPNYTAIQSQLDEGFLEVDSHSRTHTGVPYLDYDSEIGGSKSDIIGNLTLPEIYGEGENEYVWAWIAPGGASDATARQTLATYNYLVDRDAAGHYSVFSTWDSDNGLYNRYGALLADEISLQQLNEDFDDFYWNGLIYHIYFHPYAPWVEDGGNWENGVITQHLDYIKNRTTVWYVGLGALYAYHFVQERGIVQVEPVSPATEYTLTMITNGQGSVTPGNGTYHAGTIVPVNATSAPGWSFSGWSGDVSSNGEEQIIPSSEIVSELPVPDGTFFNSAQSAVYWDGVHLHVWYGVADSNGESIYYLNASKPFTSWSVPVQVIDRDDSVRDPTIFIEGNTIYLFLQSICFFNATMGRIFDP